MHLLTVEVGGNYVIASRVFVVCAAGGVFVSARVASDYFISRVHRVSHDVWPSRRRGTERRGAAPEATSQDFFHLYDIARYYIDTTTRLLPKILQRLLCNFLFK